MEVSKVTYLFLIFTLCIQVVHPIIWNPICWFGECCNKNDIVDDIQRLRATFKRKVYGQHLAESAIDAIQSHLYFKPDKPLTISFHGWAGSGKNYVSSFIAESLYKHGIKSRFVHTFIGRLHFPETSRVDEYKENLLNPLIVNVTIGVQKKLARKRGKNYLMIFTPFKMIEEDGVLSVVELRKKYLITDILRLDDENIQVYKKIFLGTFDISGKKFEMALKKSKSLGIIEEDKRGRKVPPNKIPDNQKERDLYHWIKGNVSSCNRQLFIFDEVDKMPTDLLNAIKPILDHKGLVEGVDYTQTIFIFLSNTGSNIINQHYLHLWNSGKQRENMKLSDFETLVMKGAFNEKGGFQFSDVVKSNLIDHYIPFLPMQEAHVTECIKDQYRERGIQNPTEEDIK
ncbi:unnamed protein product [Diabrotica balteata]|uniref:Uncharacterized protein n=1 Tax=Diabrotica balteata TaxID=107213 RepID=A0A9N9TDS4_DIABA|nr:unnamed protein product [Diabrotica balteata]